MNDNYDADASSKDPYIPHIVDFSPERANSIRVEALDEYLEDEPSINQSGEEIIESLSDDEFREIRATALRKEWDDDDDYLDMISRQIITHLKD